MCVCSHVKPLFLLSYPSSTPSTSKNNRHRRPARRAAVTRKFRTYYFYIISSWLYRGSSAPWLRLQSSTQGSDRMSTVYFSFYAMPHVVQVDPDSQCRDTKFIEQMGSLLDDEEHCDVTFFVGPSQTEVSQSFRDELHRVFPPRRILFILETPQDDFCNCFCYTRDDTAYVNSLSLVASSSRVCVTRVDSMAGDPQLPG